jgi:hypothetical protein
MTGKTADGTSFSPAHHAAKKRRRTYRPLLLLVAVSAGWIAFIAARNLERRLPPVISRTEFLSEVVQGHVAEVLITDRDLISGTSSTRGAFRVMVPVDDDLVKALRSRGVKVEFEQSSDLIP